MSRATQTKETGQVRTLVLVAGLLVVATATAGCSKQQADVPDYVDAVPPGVLRGVVFDLAIRPLENATVSIPVRPEVQPVVTNANGDFELIDVAPGTVFLAVTKPGYLSASVMAVIAEDGSQLVQVMLEPMLETKPYFVLESFRGLLECGVGSAPVFGLTAGCMVILGATLYIVCTGNGPVPPTGVCLGEANPYFISAAQGNMSMAQTEAVWKPTVQGQSELYIGSYVIDSNGAVVGGAPGVTGHSVLVRRLNETVVRENALGGANRLAIFVNPGNSGAANVVVQQGYSLFHTSAFHFLLEDDWVFAEDGEPQVPDRCTTC